MDKVTNILIVGVGGQGVLLASEVLSEMAMLSGFIIIISSSIYSISLPLFVLN